jgi:hypothetical protein
MDRYIGRDVHSSSCTLAVVGPSGKRLGSQVVETNAGALIEVLRGIPKQRHMCMEEGTLSEWLHEVLEPHVEELVVTGIGKKSRGPKSDKQDAFGLAEQLRIGSIESRVYLGGANTEEFAPIIEDPAELVVPTITVFEVFSDSMVEPDRGPKLEVVAASPLPHDTVLRGCCAAIAFDPR